MSKKIETALPFDNHRDTPMPLAAEFTKAIGATGVVDYLWLWDELSGWFPGTCGGPKTRLRRRSSTQTPRTTHSCRRRTPWRPTPRWGSALDGRAPLGARRALRKLISLANCTEGKVVIAVGAGELRQSSLSATSVSKASSAWRIC